MEAALIIHVFLLLFSFYWIFVGLLLCVFLFRASFKAKNKIWLITFPAIAAIALLNLNFVCHVFHLRAPIPHLKQIVSGIQIALDVAMLLLLAMKVYAWWRKKQTLTGSPPSV